MVENSGTHNPFRLDGSSDDRSAEDGLSDVFAAQHLGGALVE